MENASVNPPVAEARSIPRLFIKPRTLLTLSSSQGALVDDLVVAFRERGDVLQLSGLPVTYNMVIFRHPDHIKEIFNHDAIGIQKRHQEVMSEKIRLVMGAGTFINPGGEDWERRRRMIEPAFYRAPVLSYTDTVPDATRLMLERWEEHARTGQPFDVHKAFRMLILDISFKALFSVDLGDRLEQLHEMTHYAMHIFDHKAPLMVPTSQNKRYKKVALKLRETVQEIIAERRRNPIETRDALSHLLQARDKETGTPFTDKEIEEEIFSIYLGAYVAGAVLTWTFYLMSIHPAHRYELEREADAVLQGRLPVAADLNRLKYPIMILNESTRLFPPAWMLTRFAALPTEIGGYKVPGNSILMVPPYFAHRHPDFWENPEGFHPLRFSAERRSRIHRFAHFPFAGGARMCLGHQLATLICQLIIIQTAQRYVLDFSPASPLEPVKHFAFELEPRGHMLMTARLRQPSS